MGTEPVGLSIAFVAGILSFLSPCVLPLVPSYVSFITGMSLDEVSERRWRALGHALLFITGFTFIFMALGATATALGQMLSFYQTWLERIGGLIIIFFGLYLLGAFKLGFLNQEKRLQIGDKPAGYFGSLIVGVAFGAGWTPCIGPILGSILAYTTGTRAGLGEGLLLLFVYSLGLAVPFIAAALAVDRFLEWFQRYRRYVGLVTKITGGVLIVMGLLLLTGYFSILAGWLQGLTPEFLRERL